MKKLRAPTRKPVVVNPVWPNTGVQYWYNQQLDKLINQAAGQLLFDIETAWNKTPPLFGSHIVSGDAAPVLADAAGVMFRTPDDRVLLMHRLDGAGWAFPGGSIEANETPEAAARREAFEETLHPCNGLLELIDSRTTNGVNFATFVCEVPEVFEPILNNEHNRFVWMNPSEAVKTLHTEIGVVNAHFLHPGVRATLEQMLRVMAQDAPSPTKALQAALLKWGAQTIKQFDLASKTIATNFASRSTAATQVSMMAQLKEAGFTVQFKPTTRSIEAYRAVVAENVSLIRNIPQKWYLEIEQRVWNAVRNGSDLKTLSKDLRQTYGMTVRRAALISRDQNNKAKAVIERVRREEYGIKRAVWMHSHAGEEPRPTHVEMNGKPYSVSKGMYDSAVKEYIWPGQLINCRCTDRAVIEGFEDEETNEPTFTELRSSLNNARKFADGPRSLEMREILARQRDARTTWVNNESLREEIDQFLRVEA